MFEQFTDRARRVVVLAQEEARLLNHNYIGTEHILLGLVHEGGGVGAKALASLKVGLDDVRRQVEGIIGRGGSTPSVHIPFTPRAKKVLELSLREALNLGHNYIGTEHVLLGLVQEGEGVAAQVLTRVGVTADRVRGKVIELLSAYQDEAEGRTEARGEPVPEWLVPPQQVYAEAPGFRRFTPAAWRVVILAGSEAVRLGTAHVGAAHLLLGMLAEEEGTAARALGSVGVTLDQAREKAEQTFGRREPPRLDPPRLEGDALDVVERALHEALAVGSERLDTQHLLLGFANAAEAQQGTAPAALEALDTSVEAVWAAADIEGGGDPGRAHGQ